MYRAKKLKDMGWILSFFFRRTRGRYLLTILAPLTFLSWYVSHHYPSQDDEPAVLRRPSSSYFLPIQGAYGDIEMADEGTAAHELWDSSSVSWPPHRRSQDRQAINASGGWMTGPDILQQYSQLQQEPSATISASNKLALLLKKIEDQELIKRHELVKNLVLVVEAKTWQGSRSRDLQFYDLLAESLGLRRNVLIGSEGVGKAFDRLGKHGNSNLVLCVPEAVHYCSSSWAQRSPKIYKVNFIPQISQRLGSAVQLCNFQRENVTQKPCFVIPKHLDDFLAAAELLLPNSEWLVEENTDFKVLQSEEIYELIRDKVYNANNLVIVRSYVNPLIVASKPVQYVQVLITVTSWRPLRFHQHREGFIVLHHNCSTKNCQMNAEAILPLASITEMNQKLRLEIARVLWELLVATEMDSSENQTCSKCFQLFTVNLMVQKDYKNVEIVALRGVVPISSFNNGNGNVHKNLMSKKGSSLPMFYRHWMIDSLRLIMNRETVSKALLGPLKHVIANLNLGIVSLNSQVDHDLALTKTDLAYLIHTYQEWKASRNCHFHLTYPSTESFVISGTRTHPSYQLPQLHNLQTYSHSTSDLHKILTSFARQMIQAEREKESSYNDKLRSNSSGYYNVSYRELALYGLEFDYDLVLSPSFRPDWLEYHGHVPYQVEKLKIGVLQLQSGAALRQILLDDDIDLTHGSAAVISLGLGLNHFRLHVLHTLQVNLTYSLRITRQNREDEQPTFSENKGKLRLNVADYHAFPVCALHQNCNVRFAPDRPCGFYPLADTESTNSNWTVTTEAWRNLPYCTTGDVPGHWVLPCRDCANSSTCRWELQRWQPLGCRYPTLPPAQLKLCSKNKKVLFLGDSTNRGMMHKFLERLNGTLTNGDKIHDIRHYRAVSPASSSWQVSFAYYPQFWWPSTQRFNFEEVLHQFFLTAGPLENNTNTVLVVGGVQWMAASHVTIIRRLLIRQGLEGIQVVIKTLGSGFHLPVNGVHLLTQKHVPKLYQQSLKLAQEAKKYGMGVVDTFAMTMGRSQDFLPGRCACHFHQVINTTPVRPNKNVWRSQETRNYETFHVKGPINAMYTEILISEICGHYML